MAHIDLTEKLGYAEKPTIIIGKDTLTVNNSATNMLKIMELIGNNPENASAAMVGKAADLLFTKESRKTLDKLELSFEDFATVINAAMELVAGGDGEGEAETPATT